MFPKFDIDPQSDVPIYRQLHDLISESVATGALHRGERLPATRELAGLLGLNRTTVSAAYALLESEGLIQGHVGRGSFVLAEPVARGSGLDWERLLPPTDVLAAPAQAAPDAISFAAALLEQSHVAVVPGNDCGFDTHVRLSFATSLEQIDKGIDRIAEFLKKLG